MQHGILLFSLLGFLVATATGVFVLVNQTEKTFIPREEYFVGGIGLTENIILEKPETKEEVFEDGVQKEEQEKIEIAPDKKEKVQIKQEFTKEESIEISTEVFSVNTLPEKEEKEEVQEEQIVWCEGNLVVSPAQSTVIFNEIAWMGTFGSFRDEWIELKNISETNIHIEGWQLFDKKKDIAIIFYKRTFNCLPGIFPLRKDRRRHSFNDTRGSYLYRNFKQCR